MGASFRPPPEGERPRMGNTMARVLRLLLVTASIGLVCVGCQTSGVGDPCDPENIPEGGFNGAEAYLETSSVQCRTRVCMVYQLAGDPRNTPEQTGCNPAADPTCIPDSAIEERVYCTCRCRAPEGVNSPTCGCPGGFECVEVLELGGDGIRGSYCVNKETIVEP